MFKPWWNQRSSREQYITIAGSAIVAILLINFFIWQPLTNAVNQTRQSVIQNSALLIWMQDAKTKLSQWQGAGYTSLLQNSPLLVTTEQSLAKTGLSRHLTNTSEQSPTTLDLSFSNVPFDQLIDWLEMLWINHNIIVDKESTQKGSTDGLVNATITLTKKATTS